MWSVLICQMMGGFYRSGTFDEHLFQLIKFYKKKFVTIRMNENVGNLKGIFQKCEYACRQKGNNVMWKDGFATILFIFLFYREMFVIRLARKDKQGTSSCTAKCFQMQNLTKCFIFFLQLVSCMLNELVCNLYE